MSSIAIEPTHLLGVIVALLTYIAGRTEMFGRCLRQIRSDLDIHLAIVKHKEKSGTNAAI